MEDIHYFQNKLLFSMISVLVVVAVAVVVNSVAFIVIDGGVWRVRLWTYIFAHSFENSTVTANTRDSISQGESTQPQKAVNHRQRMKERKKEQQQQNRMAHRI